MRGLWCARGGCALPQRTVCDGLGMRTATAAKATCTQLQLGAVGYGRVKGWFDLLQQDLILLQQIN